MSTTDPHPDVQLDPDDPEPSIAAGPSPTSRLVLGLVVAAAVWVALYAINERFWGAVIYDLVGLDPQGRLGHAVHFFLYDTAKLMLLIVGLICAISLARSAISPERIRDLTAGRHMAVGLVLADFFVTTGIADSVWSVPVAILAGVPLYANVAVVTAGIMGIGFLFDVIA